jgi:hypothetical protein
MIFIIFYQLFLEMPLNIKSGIISACCFKKIKTASLAANLAVQVTFSGLLFYN